MTTVDRGSPRMIDICPGIFSLSFVFFYIYRPESCRKVMLLNLSAYSDGGRWLPSMHHRSHDQEGSTSRGGGLHPEGSAPGEGSLGRPLPQRYNMRYYGIRSTSGRYASYWNASLLTAVFLLFNSHPLISALTMRMY